MNEMAGYEIFMLRVSSGNIINQVYIIVDSYTGKTAIVDPAWNMELIEAKLARLGAVPEMILLTHSHEDHVQLADPLARKFGVNVYMSRREADYYRFGCTNLHLLDDGATVWLGRTAITGLLTPGHTAGGMCYKLEGSLFTGDTAFIEGCGICNLPGGSPDDMFDSIQRIKRVADASVRVYPGHSFGEKPGQTLGHLLSNNVYFILENRDTFVKFRMRSNQSRLFHFQ
ncbi:MBL fold metallo-hydrolase [Paenibacillus sp. MMS18-CY102]|nr:MBL fold metallo-hydrolase [Paenibacillus sp. MMS18-CY102]MWC28301.1 MBL fold metallo-hydrolase [Paenibacillus sp. MMS18-CY102]